MAFQMEYVFKGYTYPKSYWNVVQRNFNDADKTGRIVFNCYADQAAYISDVGNVIDQKSYEVTPDLYDFFFNDSITKELAYTMAREVKDVKDPANKVADAPLLGFFDTAADV